MNPRHTAIVELLVGKRELSVRDIANKFSVSLMTIRRDLSELEHEGRVIRTHGGAILSKTGAIEFDFQERAGTMAAAKQAVARAAAALVKPKTSICLDTGTTTLAVAKALAETKNIKVLTTSLAIASVLYTRPDIEVLLLGGRLRRGIPDLTGPLTEDNLERFRTNVAIVGADGLSKDGLYTTDTSTAGISAAMLRNAHTKMLVADSSKFAQKAFVRYAHWKDIDILITDSKTPRNVRKWLKKAVVRVVYAEVMG